MNAMRIALCAVAAMLAMPAFAQDPRVKEMESLAQAVKADKKQLVSRAMQLADAEAKGFWPVYEAYQKDLASINDRFVKLIVAYADAYKTRGRYERLTTWLAQNVIKQRVELLDEIIGILTSSIGTMRKR